MIKTNGGFLISQVKQIQGRVFEKLLTESGIDEFNGAQGRILYILWQKDNISIAELAKTTGLAKNTLTAMLDRMETADNIIRTPDQHDRRIIRICLTEKARGLQDKYEEVSEKMTKLFYAGFSEQEILEFEENLRRLIKNMEDYSK